MKGLLTYHNGNSFLHRLDPRTKMLMPVLICVGVFSSASFVYLALILALELALAMAGGIFRQTFAVLCRLVCVMAFLFVIQVLFIQEGDTLALLPFGLRITRHGVELALLVVLRLIDATLPLYVMLTLTRLGDLSSSLVVRCHVPYKYAFGITTAIRFVPELARNMKEIMEAQTARGVTLDTANPLRKIKLLPPLCVPLLVSSVRRIDGTAMAAELRGFNLRTPKTLHSAFSFGAADAACVLACVALAAVGIWL